jgi:hypothetical protein
MGKPFMRHNRKRNRPQHAPPLRRYEGKERNSVPEHSLEEGFDKVQTQWLYYEAMDV